MKYVINQNKCDRAPSCIAKRVCPKSAIVQEAGSAFAGGKVTIDEKLCAGCGICASYCPHGAIEEVE